MRLVSLRSAACAAALTVFGAAPGFAQDTAALEALGLGGNPQVSWDTIDQSGGGYRITGFRQETEVGVLNAETLVFENLRMGPDGAMFDTFEMRGASMDSPEIGGTFSYDRVFISGPSRALVDAMTDSYAGAADTESFSMDVIEQIAQEMILEGLRMVIPADAETETPEIRLGIDRLFASNPDLDAYADMGMTGFTLNTGAMADSPPVEVTLARAEGTGVMVASLLNGLDPETFDPALTFTKTMDRFELADFLIKVGGIRIAMPSLTASMEELAGGALRTATVMPSFSLVIDPTADEMSAQAAGGLAMMGYDRLDLSFEGASIYDPAQDRMYTDGPNPLTLADGGTFDLQYDMTGLTEYMQAAMEFQAETIASAEAGEALAVEDDLMAEMISSLILNGMSFSFEDAGLLERGLALFAAQSGVDVATARAQAVGMVALVSMGAGEALPPAVVAQMSQALTGFIQNGGTIMVAMQPPSPISMMEVATEEGGFDAEAAGLSFAHTAP
ncbi:MAG: hypothetical protein NXI12_05245 [Alphaproteobacteria bacterium]|nr:hypothetical protein [Alphaproteobacteria bacterium]